MLSGQHTVFYVQYQDDCKKFRLSGNTYAELLSYAKDAIWSDPLPSKLRFFYLDADYELISIDC